MITFENISPDSVASGVFIEAKDVRRAVTSGIIPHKVLLIGQFNSDKSPDLDVVKSIPNLSTAKTEYGLGSQLAIMAEAAFKTIGGVDLYALPIEDDGAATTADGSITVANAATSSGTKRIYIMGKQVRVGVTEGDSAATIATALRNAINAKTDLPVTASIDTGTPAVVDLTCKWAGLSGNQITLAADIQTGDDLEAPTGTTFTFSGTALSGGATDPDIMAGLEVMGSTQYTILVNPYLGTDAYNAIRLKGDELYDPIEKRMFGSITGYNDDKAALLTLLSSRNSQWFSIVPVHDSYSPPFEIAASAAGAIARSAQIDPARPFRTLELVDIRPAREDLVYSERNDVVTAGGSTTISDENGVARLEDVVTTYTTDPDTSLNSNWRFFETLTNIQNKIYMLDQVFKAAPFSRSIVVDDDSITNKAYAIRPRTVKAYAIQLVDVWVREAWSKNRDDIVAGIEAEINSGNAGRIDLLVPDVIAAGGKIIAVKLEWAFQPPITE